MNHLPWVIASYGLAAGIVAWLVAASRVRLRRAERRLRVLDGRQRGGIA